MLRRFRLQFTRSRNVWQQRQVHKYAIAAPVLAELADGLEEGQGLDIADSAADFTQHEIYVFITDLNEIFNFVGYMRNNLNGFA